MNTERWEYLANHPLVTIAANGSFVDDRHTEAAEDYR